MDRGANSLYRAERLGGSELTRAREAPVGGFRGARHVAVAPQNQRAMVLSTQNANQSCVFGLVVGPVRANHPNCTCKGASIVGSIELMTRTRPHIMVQSPFVVVPFWYNRAG